MTFAIAVAGKGGSGKTSMASLIIRYLRNQKMGPILAVDADPNANLGEGLGIDQTTTIGAVIASFNETKINLPPGLTKEAYIELKLNQAIAEYSGVDLVTMGRGEGEGCYCYPNAVLRKFIDSLAANYRFMVMDNEAGMEHLSRRTTENIDALLIVADHSIKGVRTASRIMALVAELKISVKRQLVVINRVPGNIETPIAQELDRLALKPQAVIPFDENIYRYDLEQHSLLELPDTPAALAVSCMVEELLADYKEVGIK